MTKFHKSHIISLFSKKEMTKKKTIPINSTELVITYNE